jgi:SulP family sulfate permease
MVHLAGTAASYGARVVVRGSHAPRSATIQAEVASILYVLSADQFEAIKADDPALSQKLLIYFVSVMAERLTFANRMIAVLRR